MKVIRLYTYMFAIIYICLAAPMVYAVNYSGKKVLFIDSYHEEYTWSDGVTRGVEEVLHKTGVVLKIHRMDTKRNRSETFKKEAALKAKNVIESFRPDVVIASDDNAAKYLIVPFLKDTDLPVVFCGINWDASVYGLPAGNITGMVEVELVAPLVKQLRQLSDGGKIAYLALDSFTARKVVTYHELLFNIHYDKLYFVGTYSEWKEQFLAAQNEADILIYGNPQGLSGWDEEDFIKFAIDNMKIPSGSTASWRMAFSLLGYIRIPGEQGRWAAKTALKILDGTPPASIPIVRNKEGKLLINESIRSKLGINLPAFLFKRAEFYKP